MSSSLRCSLIGFAVFLALTFVSSAAPAVPVPVRITAFNVTTEPDVRYIKYSLSDGQHREETIRLLRTAADTDAAATLHVTGSYGFKDAATGRRYSVSYTADAAGFRAHVLDLPARTRLIVVPPRPQDASELCSALRNSLCG